MVDNSSHCFAHKQISLDFFLLFKQQKRNVKKVQIRTNSLAPPILCMIVCDKKKLRYMLSKKIDCEQESFAHTESIPTFRLKQ